MNYQEVKGQLEGQKLNLLKRLDNSKLSIEEIETIKQAIDNYEYIIELTEMNHYERGISH
jgi:hypothetical protein